MAADSSRSSASFEFALASGETQWLIYVFAGAALVLAWWSWRRYGPAPAGWPGRIARICRAVGLATLVMLLAGPALRWTITRSEPGRLLIAVDHSASMARTDLGSDQRRIDLLPLLQSALTERFDPAECRVSAYRVGGRIEPLTENRPQEPDGPGSPLGDEVQSLVDEQQPDLLLLLSDGRITAGSELAAVAADLLRRGLPRQGLWALGVGSDAIEPELRIDELRAPHEVPVGERSSIAIDGSVRGLDNSKPARLVLRSGDRIIEEKEVQLGGNPEDPRPHAFQLTLDRATFDTEGEQRLTVELRQGDLSARAETSVLVKDKKWKVLILEHRPRYEMRYLREALRRDSTIEAHIYLADGRWRPWGDLPKGMDQLPLQPALLKDYDVIVIGDFKPDRILDSEIEHLHRAVTEGGSGLIWLPGETGSTALWQGKKLGQLLPARLGSEAAVQDGYLGDQPITVKRTAAAKEQYLLGGDGVEWENLPPLRGACPIEKDAVIPAATVLMENAVNGAPLVVAADMGQGRSLLVAFDDSWRWRRGLANADRHLHQFWSQLVRHVAANRGSGSQRWRVVVNPRRAVPGEAVQVGVVPAGALGDAVVPQRATMRLTGPDDRSKVVVLERPPGEQATYSATIPAPAQGTWLVEALDLPDGCQTGELVVLASETEARDPRLDADALKDLTAGSGGRTVLVGPGTEAAAAIQELVAALPDLARERQRTERRSLWDSWWLLALLGFLFATEWALRRWHRLP